MNFLKRLFGKSTTAEIPREEFTDAELDQDHEDKTTGLERKLGKMHDVVGHSPLPFELGGRVDMYYFLNHIPGTGFATMELLYPDGKGPLPNRLGTYELVAFTRHEFVDSEDELLPFNLIQQKICGIFTNTANYSSLEVLSPGDTCDIPGEDDDENTCLIVDVYQPEKEFYIGQRKHHLLLCLQIFASEMDFAIKNSGEELVVKLKEAGVYPYSDLERQPVV